MAAGHTDERDITASLREDLSDEINMISPYETPLYTNIASKEANAVQFDWQVDVLAGASDANAAIDGADYSQTAFVAPTKLRNFCQIARKDFGSSDRSEAVTKAGMASTMAYLKMKYGNELKRDVEAILFRNAAGVVGDAASVASTTAGLNAWLRTNTSAGVGGTDPTLTGTPSHPAGGAGAGALRVGSMEVINDVLARVNISGGNTDMILLGKALKQRLSSHLLDNQSGSGARVATATQDHGGSAKALSVVGAVDFYRSDWGLLSIVPDQFCPTTAIYLLDKEYLKKRVLRGFRSKDLGPNGDSERAIMLIDIGLEVCNEAAHGIIRDVDNAPFSV
jgi:hypothetical protein